MSYKAFISYSHAADGKLAPALQSALREFAKPWYWKRAVRVFRDKTSLGMTPELWPSIERALAESEYFLLLASPQAAQSQWVQQEVDWWLQHRHASKLFILLTDGELFWDRSTADFDWTRSTALPPNLQGRFKNEPLYVDLRWAKSEEKLSLRHTRFRSAILHIAAPLHGKDPDELDGEDVRQHRRFRAFVSLGLVVIVATALAAVWAAQVAIQQREEADQRRQEAERQGQIAVARQLVAQSDFARAQSGDLLEKSILLAVEGIRRHADARSVSSEADHALRSGLVLLPRLVSKMSGPYAYRGKPVGYPLHSLRFTADGRYFPTVTGVTAAEVWNPESTQPIFIANHGHVITDVAMSSDSRLLVTTGMDHKARLWLVPSGQPGPTMNITSSFVEHVSFSHDGKHIVTSANGDPIVRVWASGTGQAIVSLEHKEWVQAFAISREDTYLATLSSDNSVCIWRNWQTQHPNQVAHFQLNKRIKGLIFAPDSTHLITTGDTVTRIWRVANGKLAGSLPQQRETVGVASFSSDGKYLATASGRRIKVWQSPDWQETAFFQYEAEITALTFSHDGKRLAVAGQADTVKVWQVNTGQLVAIMPHHSFTRALEFSPSGRYLVTVGEERLVRVWGTARGEPFTIGSEEDSVNDFAFSPSGPLLATGSQDGTAWIWDVTAQDKIQRFQHEQAVNAVTFSSDGSLLATTSSDKTTKIWRASDGLELLTLPHQGVVSHLAFSHDSTYLAATSEDNKVGIWEMRSGTEIAHMEHDDRVNSVAFSPDDGLLATGNGIWRNYINASILDIKARPKDENTARLWIATSGQLVATLQHGNYVNSLAFNPNGRYLATASGDHTARVWEVPQGKEILRLHHKDSLTSVAFSPNGTYLATASHDGTSRIWEIPSGRSIAVLTHEDRIRTATFDKNGDSLVTASDDTTARIWEVPSGRLTALIKGVNGVRDVIFSTDGKYLALRRTSGVAEVWHVRAEDLIAIACSHLTRNLTKEEWKQYLPDEPYRKTCPDLP